MSELYYEVIVRKYHLIACQILVDKRCLDRLAAVAKVVRVRLVEVYLASLRSYCRRQNYLADGK